MRAHRGGQFDPHVAEPAEPDDPDLAAFTDAILAKRRKGGDPGAQQGRDAGHVHAGGYLADEMVADHDMVRIAALGQRSVLLVDPVIGADHPFLAKDFPAVLALLALHATVDHAADRDGVADLMRGDVAADRGDGADDFVARDHRIAAVFPVVAAGVKIAVTDAGVADLDRHVVGSKIAALEAHRLERLVGGVGAPSLGGGRHMASPELAGAGEQSLCLGEMGAVDHPTIH